MKYSEITEATSFFKEGMGNNYVGYLHNNLKKAFLLSIDADQTEYDPTKSHKSPPELGSIGNSTFLKILLT